MKSPAQVQELSAWLAAAGIGLLELRTPEGVLRLGRAADPGSGLAPPEARDEDAPPACVAAAPSVGLFLHAHPLQAAPLARPGQRVPAGQPVGLVRIGPLLLPVTAPRAGLLVALLAPEGQPVGWGTPVAELQPEE